MQRLRVAGVLVLPIAQGSNYLEVDCVSDSLGPIEVLKAIPMLKGQLVSLRCSGVGRERAGVGGRVIAAAGAAMAGGHTAITGANLGELRGLVHLKYLNLTGTGVGAADIVKLKGLSKLAVLYLYLDEGWDEGIGLG